MNVNTVFEPAVPEVQQIVSERRSDGATVVRMLKAVVASVTYVSAILLYCGWAYTQARTSYFGIYSSVLGYPSQEYILRSANVLFRPGLAAALIVLVGVAVNEVASRLRRRSLWSPRSARLYIALRWSLAATGVLLVLVGYGKSFGGFIPSQRLWEGAAALLAGTALCGYAVLILPPCRGDTVPLLSPPAHRIVRGLILLAICLESFWLVDNYANQLGDDTSRQLAGNLAAVPGVIVYSSHPLGITGPGVRVDTSSSPDGTTAYRYDGLCLLSYWSRRYFLLPVGWDRENGDRAVVLPETDTTRVEFRPACARVS
ncbi:MAG TPA: hypothetical protein VH419_03455 [Nocardioidaceae bacterium]|jgi:hypothetical protein